MREAANILDIIRAKRRLSERDRAFLEAITDALDDLADARTLGQSPVDVAEYDEKLQWVAMAYNNKED